MTRVHLGYRNKVIRNDHDVAGYELQELVARSRTGVLYRARDVRLQRQVALRIVAADIAADPVTRARLNREVTALASVDHPNVPPIYEAGEDAGRIFIASRWIDATRLSDLVRDRGGLEPRRAVRIANQIAAALEAAHALGIIHRNVKPSRVLVAAGDHTYLTDFSVARRLGDRTGLTAQAQLVEEFDYVAPEYIEGRNVDARVDIYGLGCVLYETLTGELPYPRAHGPGKMYAHLSAEPPSPREHRPEVPPALDSVVRRAMAKDPDARQQSAAQFAAQAAGAVDLSAPLWVTHSPVSRGSNSPVARSDRAAIRPDQTGVAMGSGQAMAGRAGRALAPAASADKLGSQPAQQVAHRSQQPAGQGDGFSEMVYFGAGHRRLRKRAIRVLAALVFLVAPIALLIAIAAHAATI